MPLKEVEAPPPAPAVKQGFKSNWLQLSILIGCLFALGGLFGLERTLLPLMAESEFGKTDSRTVTSIVIAFGASKAVANGVAGLLADKFGRKIMVIVGMCMAIPVPLIILFATSWWMVTIANLGLGGSQGLAASAIVMMLIDLLGQEKRGIAVGILECSIYVSVAIWSFLGLQIANQFGYQPIPFTIGAIIAIIGAFLSLFAKDTLQFISLELQAAEEISDNLIELDDIKDNEDDIETSEEIGNETTEEDSSWLAPGRVWCCVPSVSFVKYELTTIRVIIGCLANKQISLCTAIGVVNNIKDGVAWVVFPLYFTEWNVDKWIIGILMLIYPLTWGVLQLFTGAASDRFGRKPFLAGGVGVQAVSLLCMIAIPFAIQDDSWRIALWFYSLAFLGFGTALIYPVVQAAVGDEVPSEWRGVGIGMYRFCRDMGYVAGALVAGLFISKWAAILVVAILLMLTCVATTFFFIPSNKEKAQHQQA